MKLNINRRLAAHMMGISPESYFDSFHKTPQGNFKNSYYNPFHIKPRKRTSKEQLEVLEKTFETNIKPDAALRKTLADRLNMTPRSVQVWFQNKRAKVKNEKTFAQRKQPQEEIEISSSLYAKKEEDPEEKCKEDYEYFLLNYPGFNQDYECSVPQKQYLEETPSFKEEDLESLDKLILGVENSQGENILSLSKREKAKGDGEEEDPSYNTFYSIADTLNFDPSNYLN